MVFNPIVTGIKSGIYFETIINPNSILSIMIYNLTKIIIDHETKY